MMKFTAILSAIALLFGCSSLKPQVDDGPGMVYKDYEYRTEYANVLEFDSWENKPCFAVAFLGYGDRMEFRNTYLKSVFKNLSEESIDKIQHFDFEGDEWYLVVPRYKDRVDICDAGGTIQNVVYQGEAFTVKCNLSDLHSNIVISSAGNDSAFKFSPQIGGDGKLLTNEAIYDITDYIALEENDIK